MKKLILFLAFALPLFVFSQGTITNPWVRNGNIIGNNTDFLGTRDARSLRFKTNNTLYGVLDSVGNMRYFGPLSVNLGTLVAASPRTFSFMPYSGSSSLPAIYAGIGVPTPSNYAWAAADSTIFIYNAPSTMRFNTNHTNWLIASTTHTTAHSMVTISGVNIPTVAANANVRAFTIGGRTIGWNTGSNSLQQDILFSSHTYTSNGAHSITNAVQVEFNAPTIGTGVTVSGTTFATYHKGNSNITSKLSIGSTLLNPLAVLHLAAPATGTPAIKFTTHTIPTLNAGEIDYNTTSGFNLQGNMILSGTQTISTNQIVVGTASVGSTFTAGAGLRCVGAASVVSTLSVGSTCTFAASVRIGSSTAPTALLHLAAGTTAASTAPLKFTSGSLMTAAEAGAIEFLTDDYYATITTSTARHKLARCLTGSAALDFPSTLTMQSADLTITVTGAVDGDPVQIGVPNAALTAGAVYWGWVSASNTVTIRFFNSNSGSQNPASGTFKVTINKN